MFSSYCKIYFNWNSDDPSLVTTYTFIDVEESLSSDFSCDDEQTDNGDGSRRASSSICGADTSVRVFKQGSSDSLTATITCSDPSLAMINGISIESESRTLELSNDSEGYIKSIRGKIRKHGSSQLADSDYDHPDYFVCATYFNQLYSSLSIKFLSLGDKETVRIHSIKINIQQHQLGGQLSTTDMFDMAKLKNDIDAMGDAVSDRALDFFKTMETFELNKMKSMGSLGGFAINGNEMAPAMSVIMKSVMGDTAMVSLEKDVLKNQSEPANSDDIFSMLQAVCGKVSESRKPVKDKPSTPNETCEDQIQLSADHGLTNGKQKLSPLILELFSQKLEEAKQDMRSEMESVKTDVLCHIDQVKREMTVKLDSISSMLEVLVKSQSPTGVSDKGIMESADVNNPP